MNSVWLRGTSDVFAWILKDILSPIITPAIPLGHCSELSVLLSGLRPPLSRKSTSRTSGCKQRSRGSCWPRSCALLDAFNLKPSGSTALSSAPFARPSSSGFQPEQSTSHPPQSSCLSQVLEVIRRIRPSVQSGLAHRDVHIVVLLDSVLGRCVHKAERVTEGTVRDSKLKPSSVYCAMRGTSFCVCSADTRFLVIFRRAMPLRTTTQQGLVALRWLLGTLMNTRLHTSR